MTRAAPADPIAALIDHVVPDGPAHAEARRRLAAMRDDGISAHVHPRLAAILADAASPDPWTRRARPAFLYLMYALILWSLPIGLLAAVSPAMAAAITRAMTAYLAALPEPLYALFGTGYLGYTAARVWGKVKGVER